MDKNQEMLRKQFETLYQLNVNDKTEKKGNLTYLTWSFAWAEFVKVNPDATYEIVKNEQGLPYFSDPAIGIMVYTKVTCGGLTHEMWLPVMDDKNNAMKEQAYTIQTWSRYERKYIDTYVAAANMFDVNKAIMRCLVKNLAMFGLGLYIYAGDDLPEGDDATPAAPAPAAPTKKKATKAPEPQQVTLDINGTNDPLAGIKNLLKGLNTLDDMMEAYKANKDMVESNPNIKTLFGLRKQEIKNAQK